jgi:hypothetical protein
MKPPVERGKMKRWLGLLWQGVLAGIAVTCAIVIPRSAHAAKTEVGPSFSERATKVKQAIDKMAPSMTHSNSAPHLMQWYNWGNWNNWPNWANWNNWSNWGNWYNW